MATATQLRSTDAAAILGAHWELDPAHTTLEFAVKHMMITTVRGRFGKVSGSLHVDPDHPSEPEVNVDIDAASIDTRESKRDEHLRSPDFLDAPRHPTLTFRGGRVEGDATGRFRLIGDLTIRGITRQVTLNAKYEGHTMDPWGGERIGFSATTQLNRHDYDLRWNVALETGGVLVGDTVQITIDTQFVKKDGAPGR